MMDQPVTQNAGATPHDERQAEGAHSLSSQIEALKAGAYDYPSGPIYPNTVWVPHVHRKYADLPLSETPLAVDGGPVKEPEAVPPSNS